MATKVLIVLDGAYRFDDGAVPVGTLDFTYKALVTALTGAGMDVTKAHRAADSTADIPNFNFVTSGDLLQFDAIWLIGFDGRNVSGSTNANALGAAQLNAIATYMDHGGGVFATGDHDSIGANMCGFIPRVRAARCWFGDSDPAKPVTLATLPDNWPPTSADRADTVQTNPAGTYSGHPAPFIWFENQSDSVPQPMTPATSPTHPILKRGAADILVYPDHMHEGRTLGEVMGHDYAQNSPFGDTGKAEFREVAGHRELPEVIATGQVRNQANFFANDVASDSALATPKTNNILSVYDGRVAGVGRIVTGATFHHYVDINLTGDTDIVAGPLADKVGADAIKGHGFNDNAAVFDDIKAVFVNITNWIARPRAAIGLIVERSTFSQDEVSATPQFEAAILLTVDGLKPTQFPGGGIPGLGAIAGTPAWVPAITVPGGVPIAIEPSFVDSDDPGMPDRLQRFTFTYRVHFTGNAFGFAGPSDEVPIQVSLASGAILAPLTDAATLVLVKSANPFMLDVADGNQTSWLSSDVKVFHVIAGEDFLGVPLPANASRAQALTFLRSLASSISFDQFRDLPSAQAESKLSLLPMTTESPVRKVYNFALARVRLSGAGADAADVRVFFRMFTSQTTAALTYNIAAGMPVEGYLKSGGANPIALPGTHNGGSEWLSFPFFSAERASPQTDPDNVQPVDAGTGFRIFGALLDNNLTDPYLTLTPTGGGALQPLPTLLMGEHQCLVAQIEHVGTPIPSGARPWTSDKLSQRNIAMSEVANPGLDASRVALHTFEIEATPHPVSEALPPDELLLDWSGAEPAGTVLRIHIPSWDAAEVVALANRLYPRHEIQAVDAHTIELPGGGTRYVPIPMSQKRQTGVLSVELPLGIKRGQRFDVSVRQITNRVRRARIPAPKMQRISREEAATLAAAAVPGLAAGAGAPTPKAIDLGNNRVLVLDLSVYDAAGDHALIVEHPDPEIVRQAASEAGQWRETIGAFQLGVPVSTRGDMQRYHAQLLSVMRWRVAHLSRNNRWRPTMDHYLELLTDKVRALGVDPYTIPATPDGAIPPLKGDGTGEGDPPVAPGGGDAVAETLAKLRKLFVQLGCGLVALVLLILLLFWYLVLR